MNFAYNLLSVPLYISRKIKTLHKADHEDQGLHGISLPFLEPLDTVKILNWSVIEWASN